MNIRIFFFICIGIIISVVGLFSWSAYSYYETIHADDPIIPYLEVKEWDGKIIRENLTYELKADEKYDLEKDDIVETGKASKASIYWPDKSITRLGPNTRVVIKKMFATKSYDTIQIAYDIERGKVWNTVIRSLVGDSFFEVHLPRESIVAWVRWTVFEVNLDNGYIQAVDHMMVLTDASKKILELFPGELVDSENIWVKKWKEWIDSSWNELNTNADTIYKSLREAKIQERITGLTKWMGEASFANMQRKLIAQFPGFESLEIAELLEKNDTEKLKKYSWEVLFSYYQKLNSLSTEENKDTLRKALLEMDNPFIANIRDSLNFHALLDSLDRGKLLPTTENYLKKNGIDLTEFQSRLRAWAKNNLNTFRESFSGSLDEIFSLPLPN